MHKCYIQVHIIFVRQGRKQFFINFLLGRNKWNPHFLLQVICQYNRQGLRDKASLFGEHTAAESTAGLQRPTLMSVQMNKDMMPLPWEIWNGLQLERLTHGSPIALGASSWNTVLKHTYKPLSLSTPTYGSILIGWPINCSDWLWWKSYWAPLVNLFWREIGQVILTSWERKCSLAT